MMSLKNYLNMDVYMLLSAVNMQLRDEFESVSSLCSYHEIDEEKLIELMNAETWLNAEQCIEYGLADKYAEKEADMSGSSAVLQKASPT